MADTSEIVLKKDLFTAVVVAVFIITVGVATYLGTVAPSSENIGATYELGSAVANLGTMLVTLFLFVILFQSSGHKQIDQRSFLTWVGIAIIVILTIIGGYLFSPTLRAAITQTINYISDILLFIFASVFVYKEYSEKVSKNKSK